MNKNTLIGLGIGAAALYAGWHLYGRRWMQVARGNAATVRQQVAATRPTVAQLQIARNAPQARAAGAGLERRRGASIDTGFQGAYDAGMALRAGANA